MAPDERNIAMKEFKVVKSGDEYLITVGDNKAVFPDPMRCYETNPLNVLIRLIEWMEAE